MSGDFVGSPYNDNFRVGYKTGTNPFVLAGFGPGITDETKAAIEEAQAWLATEEAHLPRPGRGPGRRGRHRGRRGTDYAENDAMDFFVQGVVGNLAQ